jgi:mannose/fructose/N-acetylgalactosamine-specific phosphotransferase system component IID
MKESPKQSILFRSLALQLFLNYKTMQGPGYLMSLRPMLRDDPQLDQKAHAAASFVNGHPVFSSAALGAMSELLKSRTDDVHAASLKDWKRQISTPMGAIGDHLIWERFKPALLALLATLLLLAGQSAAHVWVIAVTVMFITYNLSLWLFREWMFARGAELKENLPELAAHPGLPKLKKFLRVIGIFAAAGVLAASSGNFAHGGTLANSQFIAGFAVMLLASKLRVSTLTAAFFAVLSMFGLYYIFQA